MLVLFSIVVSVEKSNEALKVTFFDVGQGDAIFIESPSGVQVLIDGGRDQQVLSSIQGAMGFFDRDIDLVVATHGDADHIGGLTHIFARYKVGAILMTENVNNTPAYEAFISKAQAEGVAILYARRGQVFDLGIGSAGSTTLTVLFPDHDPHALETNLSSIVARLTYGESEYLLTGDSPKEIESYLVALGTELRSDVLKVGHHGSKTSSDETFVRAVSPSYAIISAGRGNAYGHPHAETIARFEQVGAVLLSTQDLGTIETRSDGKTISILK